MAGDSVGDVEQLVVLLEAKITDFEKQMAKASATATKSYGEMRAGSKSATAAMEADAVLSSRRIQEALAEGGTRLGEVGKSAFEGLQAALLPAAAGIIGISAAIEGAKQALEDFDKVAKEAKASGLSAEDFQALAYSANLGGVETDTFASAMETFAKNSGQAEAGIGRLIGQLKALDPQLLAQIQHATTQKERLDLVADALQKETDASKRAAIANALFGDSGARMIEVLKDGSKGLDEMGQKARAMGIVVSNDLIANAEQMSDQFDTASQILNTQFKTVLVQLAPLLVSTATGIGEVAKAVATVVDQFKDVGQRTLLTPLQNQLVMIENQIATMKETIASEQASADSMPDSVLGIPNIIKSGKQSGIDAYKSQLDQLYQQAAQYQDRIDQLQGMGAPKVTQPTGDTSGGVFDYKASEAAQKKIDGVTTSLKDQLAALTMTAREQAEANALQQAGITLDDKRAAGVVNLADRLYDEKTALQAAKDAEMFLAQTAESTLQGMLDGTTSVTDGLLNMVKALAEAALQAELLGSGPLAGLFGTTSATSGGVGGLFGSILSAVFPGHADGTANTGGVRGQPAGIVHGQEAVIPLPNGGKVPVQITGGSAQSSPQEVHVTVGVSVDNNGNLQAYVQNVAHRSAQDGIEQYDSILPSRLRQIQRDPRAA